VPPPWRGSAFNPKFPARAADRGGLSAHLRRATRCPVEDTRDAMHVEDGMPVAQLRASPADEKGGAMKCSHVPCDCEGKLDRNGKTYCSDAMKSATSEQRDCTCGHAGCGAKASLKPRPGAH
jgi:hypothetical protein